jgi:hypothetical protein
VSVYYHNRKYGRVAQKSADGFTKQTEDGKDVEDRDWDGISETAQSFYAQPPIGKALAEFFRWKCYTGVL